MSPHQIEAEWAEVRQALNDARMSDYSLPEAIVILLGYRDNVYLHGSACDDPDCPGGSKSRHPSTRRRAALTVLPGGAS